MSTTATQEDVRQLQSEMKESFDDLTAIMREFMQQVDDRVTNQDRKYDRLIETIDGFIQRIDK